MRRKRVTRRLVRWLNFLDAARVYRSRVFFVAWIPVGVAAAVSETPRPDSGHVPWILAIMVATAVAWLTHIGFGLLVPRVRARAVRRLLIPISFAIVGLVRGVTIGVLADRYDLLVEMFWGVRILSGVLGGIVLMSAVTAVERAGALLVESQRESRRLRLRVETVRGELDNRALVRAWAQQLHAIVRAHFTETPWTRAGQEIVERTGPATLTARLHRWRHGQTRSPDGPPPSRRRQASSLHAHRFIALASVRLGAARIPLAVTLPLAVVALHGGVTRQTGELVLTALFAAVAGGCALAGAAAAGLLDRSVLVRVAGGWRAAVITAGFATLGLTIATVIAVLNRAIVSSPTPAEPLLIGVLPVVAVIVGWAAIIVEGVNHYATLIRRHNSVLAAELAAAEVTRERQANELDMLIDRAQEEVLTPLIAAIAATARRTGCRWISPLTGDHVHAAVEAAVRAVTNDPATQFLDDLTVEWVNLAFVEVYGDDDAVAIVRSSAPHRIAGHLRRVRKAIADAVIHHGATAIDVSVEAVGGELTVSIVHNGAAAPVSTAGTP